MKLKLFNKETQVDPVPPDPVAEAIEFRRRADAHYLKTLAAFGAQKLGAGAEYADLVESGTDTTSVEEKLRADQNKLDLAAAAVKAARQQHRDAELAKHQSEATELRQKVAPLQAQQTKLQRELATKCAEIAALECVGPELVAVTCGGAFAEPLSRQLANQIQYLTAQTDNKDAYPPRLAGNVQAPDLAGVMDGIYKNAAGAGPDVVAVLRWMELCDEAFLGEKATSSTQQAPLGKLPRQYCLSWNSEGIIASESFLVVAGEQFFSRPRERTRWLRQ